MFLLNLCLMTVFSVVSKHHNYSLCLWLHGCIVSHSLKPRACLFLFSTHESVISNQAQSSNTKIIFRAHSHWPINLCWPDGFSQGPGSTQCSNPALWTLFRKVQMSLTCNDFQRARHERRAGVTMTDWLAETAYTSLVISFWWS